MEKEVNIDELMQNPENAVRYINERLGINASEHPASFLTSSQLIERIENPPSGSMWEETYEAVLKYGIMECIRKGNVWDTKPIIQILSDRVEIGFDNHQNSKTLGKFLTFLKDDYSK